MSATSEKQSSLFNDGAVDEGPPRSGIKPSSSIRPLGECAAMKQLLFQVERAAKRPVSILIIGETGTGKDVIARYLHSLCDRADKQLISLNCGAIPDSLVASTLFGHVKGAFTGANEHKKGVFAEANGGVLFLDEVGELSPSAQVSLLRALELKLIMPVGASKELSVDVRIVAATHRDLFHLVRQGKFREDLLYRLNVVTLSVPPLRARGTEIITLARVLLDDIASTWSCERFGLTLEAQRALARYDFPGNVRELRNILEHASLLSEGTEIQLAHLPHRVLGSEELIPTSAEARDRNLPFREQIAQYERALILEALKRERGNQTKAAQELGIPRRTLVHKLRLYEMETITFAPSIAE